MNVQPTSFDDGGWSGYPDERGGTYMFGMGAVDAAPLSYPLNTTPVGSQASYWPGDVTADAHALNFLGFIPDTYFSQLKPSTGSQQGDMSASAGAWDPVFRQGVTDFQDSVSITTDGWIGPQTRTALAAAVAVHNAQATPNQPPFVPPAVIPVPGVPPAVPPAVQPGGGLLPPVPNPMVQPASAQSSTPWTTYALIAGGVVALGAAAYLLID